MNNLKSRVAGIFLAAAFSAMPLAPAVLAAEPSGIEQVIESGRLRVGLSTFVPWAVRDKSGELIGFEVDVVTKLAKDLGVELDLVATAWDGIIPAFLAGNFDLIAGGLGINVQRNLSINFTSPYNTTTQGGAFNKELAGNLKYPDDFNDPSIIFACRRGATPCGQIAEEFPLAQIRQFDNDALAYQEVIDGRAHAILAGEPRPTLTVLQHPDKLFTQDLPARPSGYAAFAVRKGDVDTLNVINNWILVNHQNGFFEERANYWFRSLEWADQVPAE